MVALSGHRSGGAIHQSLCGAGHVVTDRGSRYQLLGE